MNIFNSVAKMVADAASQASENALKTAVAAGETIGNAASSAGQVVTGTVAGVGEAVGSAALTVGQSAVEIATKTSSEAIAFAASQVVLERIVPVFLLPTGSSNQTFKCIFHFDIANLTSGLLVRPQAQVWTGCAGIDSTYLAQTLKEDFIRQFKTAHKSKLKHEQQKFEADFDSKNKAFIEAVNNMAIHVHPVLQEVIALFSELDSIPFFPVNVEPPATAFPPVNELLNRSDYRKQLPVEYHTLIDLVLQG